MAKTRRAYTGASVETTISSAIAASGTTTFTVSAATNWPYGSDPYHVVLSPGTASEEKVLVTRTGASDTTINIASDSERGQDGTSAVSHDSGATVYPVFTAVDADEANELASMWEAKGDIVSHGTSTFSRLAVGTNDYVLQADSSAASGLAWGQVDTASIANDAVTNAKIAANAVDTGELAANAVTEAKLATAVVNKLVPAGTISATIRSTSDTGYLLLDGSTVASAQTTYPALWAVVPSSWQSGSSLVLPDMSDKMLFGQTTTTLGATGGTNSKTIAEANLPTHDHSLSAHTHTMSSHTHSLSSHTHSLSSHTHTVDPDSASTGGPNDDIVRRLSSYSGGYVIPIDSDNDGFADFVSYGVGAVGGMAVSGSDFSHTHTINLPSKTSSGPSNNTSGAPSTANTGSNNNATSGPSAANTSDGGFANNALDVTNAHLAVNFQIKAH